MPKKIFFLFVQIIILFSIIFVDKNLAWAEVTEDNIVKTSQSLVSELSQPYHAIAIFGEPKYGQDFKHFDYVNPSAPKGGDVKLASIGTFDNLNPFIIKGVAPDQIGLLFDSLITSPADEPGAAYGLVAESMEYPEDRKWIIFNLRKEARWQDNTPITADDIVFSFYTLLKDGHPRYQLYYKDVEKVIKLSDRRVQFIFKNTKNRELPIIVGAMPILSEKYYKNVKFNETTLTPPLGSGPYKVAKISPGRWIKYELLKNYWGKNLPVNKGRYNFGTIRYDFYRDDTVAVEALKAGEYDFRRENISKTWAKAYNIPQIKDGRMIKDELKDGSPTGMQSFVFNTRRAKFSNPKVREALNYAYDFEWSNKTLFFSAYKRNSSFFGNSEYESSGLITPEEVKLLDKYREILPPRLFTDIYKLPVTNGDGNNRQNLIKAQQLLDEAGLKIKDFKRIDPATGEPFKIEFLLSSPSFERVISPFAKNLKKLGIETSVRTVDASQYIKRQEVFDFDILVNWYIQGSYPGNEEYNYWHSKMVKQNGSLNLAGVNNKAVDMLVKKIINAKDKDKLLIYAHALDRVLLWNFYVIPQWNSRTHRVIYWNKFGRPKIVPPYSLSFEDTWWVK